MGRLHSVFSVQCILGTMLVMLGYQMVNSEPGSTLLKLTYVIVLCIWIVYSFYQLFWLLMSGFWLLMANNVRANNGAGPTQINNYETIPWNGKVKVLWYLSLLQRNDHGREKNTLQAIREWWKCFDLTIGIRHCSWC